MEGFALGTTKLNSTPTDAGYAVKPQAQEQIYPRAQSLCSRHMWVLGGLLTPLSNNNNGS